MSDSPAQADQTLATDATTVQAQLDQLELRFGDLQRQLRRAQKLASLGTMSAMLAHEFKNLLTPVVSYAHYALEKGQPALMRAALEKTLQQSAKVTTLCERILGMAVDCNAGPAATPLRQIVDEAVGCLGRDLSRDNITLRIQVDPSLRVRANPNQLQQVIFNLVLNARQAMLGRPGHLTITAAKTDQHVRITVRDTGVGISPEDLPHIFEPFFTTKRHADRPDKRGIGLGLAVCKDIIDEHAGTIEVDSKPAHGTTFTVTLPAVD